MKKDVNFDTLKYFLECYFNEGTDYDELGKIISDFNATENFKYRNSLSTEVKQIIQSNYWDYIQDLIKEYGMRRMNKEKVRWFIQYLASEVKTD